jgi:hypothetical protein
VDESFGWESSERLECSKKPKNGSRKRTSSKRADEMDVLWNESRSEGVEKEDYNFVTVSIT